MRKHLITAAVVAAVSATALTGCGKSHKPACTTSQVMFFSTTDHHYHYGSPTGSTVPAYAVPKSAQSVKGYVPTGPKTAPKTKTVKPAAPKAPSMNKAPKSKTVRKSR